jgi:hypothetical protein
VVSECKSLGMPAQSDLGEDVIQFKDAESRKADKHDKVQGRNGSSARQERSIKRVCALRVSNIWI